MRARQDPIPAPKSDELRFMLLSKRENTRRLAILCGAGAVSAVALLLRTFFL